MKKLLKVSLMAMLVAAPFAANATVTLPLKYVNQAGTAYNEANRPASLTASNVVASKSYVDGAYNELAEAVNTVNSNALTLSTAETGTFTKSAGNTSSASIGDASTIGDAINNVASAVDANTTAIAGKANASTTLAGYGITDAYTKTEVDTAVGAKLDTSKANVASNGNYIVAGDGVATNLGNLDTQVKANADAIATKATASTTLAGYGITDAYTKSEVDTAVQGVQDDLDNKRVEVVQTWGSATTSKVALVDNN